MMSPDDVESPLRILFASDHTYLPDRYGGREQSTHELAQLCQGMGHEAAVVAREHDDARQSASRGGRPHGTTIFRNFATHSQLLLRRQLRKPPYQVFRADDVVSTTNSLLGNGRFDCAIIQFRQAHQRFDFSPSLAHRYFVYFRDANSTDGLSPTSYMPSTTLIANSEFVGQIVGRLTQRHVSVLVPYVDRLSYRTQSEGDFVTFINPVPVKGLDLAIDIAEACPDIRFLFVEGWPSARRTRSALRARIGSSPNIVQHPGVDDMRRIYRRTRLLLMPSQWPEAWGRVVTEAQFSGIPVLARDTGGLAESVGDGGLLMPPSATATAWIETLRDILNDGSRYSDLAARSIQRADRYWQQAQDTGSTFIELIRSGLSGQISARPPVYAESSIMQQAKYV